VNGQAVQIIAEVAALSERFGAVNDGMNNQSAGALVARQGRQDGGGQPGGPSGPAGPPPASRSKTPPGIAPCAGLTRRLGGGRPGPSWPADSRATWEMAASPGPAAGGKGGGDLQSGFVPGLLDGADPEKLLALPPEEFFAAFTAATLTGGQRWPLAGLE